MVAPSLRLRGSLPIITHRKRNPSIIPEPYLPLEQATILCHMLSRSVRQSNSVWCALLSLKVELASLSLFHPSPG